MKRTYFTVSILFTLILCGCEPKEEGDMSGPKPLSSSEIAYLEEMGSVGQGWAYSNIALDAEFSNDFKRSSIYTAKALQANDPTANGRYAQLLLDHAMKMDKSDIRRKILLNEAKRRAEVALINTYTMPDIEKADNASLERNSLLYRSLLTKIIEQ